MPLNKKQKEQIDTARKKISAFQQLIAAAKKQPDDPNEVPRLNAEIAKQQEEIAKVQAEG